jgi:hypothetical protein
MRLSPGTRRRVDHLFQPEDREAAAQLLVDECGTGLPFCSDLDARALERVRYAALKVSEGDLSRLREAVSQANVDWRDLLVAAAFNGDVHAHESWPGAPATE